MEIISSGQSKGVNFVLEAVSVWLKKRYISIPINIGVPSQNYRYILFIYLLVKFYIIY